MQKGRLAFFAALVCTCFTLSIPAVGRDFSLTLAERRSKSLATYARIAELAADDLRQFVEQAFSSLDDEGAAVSEAAGGESLARATAAVVLRAGLDSPPGLSAARERLRKGHSSLALELVREGLASERAGPWNEALRSLLEEPPAGEGVLSWCAAAHTASVLRRYEFARDIAAGLERGPAQHASAQRALFRMFQRWFEDSVGFADHWAQLGETAPTAAVLETARGADLRARAYAVELFASVPASALQALSERDPILRARAAEALRAASSSTELHTDELIERLLEMLSHENDPGPFSACLDTLLELIASAAPEAEPVRLLRLELQRRIELDHPGLRAPLARGLARVPWLTGEPLGPDSILRGLEGLTVLLSAQARGARLIQGAEVAGGVEPFDADVAITALEALATLSSRADAEKIDLLQAAGAAREAVFELLSLPSTFESVRVTAAGTISPLATPRDIGSLEAALDDSSRSLRYGLLGAVGRLAEEGAGTPDGDHALAVLVTFLAAEDPSLRQRALDLFAAPGLAGLRARVESSFFVERLRVETDPQLSLRWIELFGEHADAKGARALVEASVFGRLIAQGNGVLQATTANLVRACESDVECSLYCADRLVAASTPEAREAHLRQALHLLAAVTPEAAAGLTTLQHARLVDWALELRQSTDRPLTLNGHTLEFLRRLIDVHLPALEKGKGFAAALFEGDAFLAGQRAEESFQRARVVYASALASLQEQGQEGIPADLGRLRRERMRFFDAAGYRDDARAELAEIAGSGEAGLSHLTDSDLRRAAELFALAEGAGNETLICDWTWRFVQRDSWQTLTPAQRAVDLVRLVERAFAAGDAQRAARVREFANGVLAEEGGLSAELGEEQRQELEVKLVGLDALQPPAAEAPVEGPEPDEPPGGPEGEPVDEPVLDPPADEPVVDPPTDRAPTGEAAADKKGSEPGVQPGGLPGLLVLG